MIKSPGFSIVITTFDSFSYLKLLLYSLEKYSALDNEILIHVDGSKDGTQEWLKEKGYSFTESENLGKSNAINTAAQRATRNYIFWMNDDMFVAPNWDLKLLEFARPNLYPTVSFIEPPPSSHIEKDFGKHPDSFEEENFVRFLENYDTAESLAYGEFTSCGLLETKKFFEIGGFDTRYDKFGANDADYLYRIYLKYPEMRFGKADHIFIYHFSGGTVKRHPEVVRDNSGLFQSLYGVDFQEATRRMRQRSLELPK